MEQNIKKQATNQVEINGTINKVTIMSTNSETGKTLVFLRAGTKEHFDKGDRWTNHNIKVFANSEQVEKFKALIPRISAEDEKNPTISLTGVLESDRNYGSYVKAAPENIQLDVTLRDEKGKNINVGNRVDLKGHVDRIIAVGEGFVKVDVRTFYMGNGQNNTVSLNESIVPEAYKAVMDGIEQKDGKWAIKEGTKIEINVRGQMHNNHYTKDGKEVYNIDVTAKRANVVLGEKKAQEQKAAPEQKAEKAPAKKAAAAKKPEAPKAKKTAKMKLA